MDLKKLLFHKSDCNGSSASSTNELNGAAKKRFVEVTKLLGIRLSLLLLMKRNEEPEIG